MSEVFLPIPTVPGYSVSSHGRVRNDTTMRIMKPKGRDGKEAQLPCNNVRGQKTYGIPKLMWLAFFPDSILADDEIVICDGLLRPENIKVMTRSQHSLHINNGVDSRDRRPVVDSVGMARLLAMAW